jgi:transposase
MDVLHTCCCGLDIHKKTVVACLLHELDSGEVCKELRTFSTMTADLLALSDWLETAGCTHVAMESTGVYWKPIYNLLEGLFELLVVNAHHLKTVPGRKTDMRDAEWIADLLRHGLLRGSFIPSREQRELRDLTRYRRSLVEDRARVLNRLQKVLEDANIKLAAVASDLHGVSARAMLEALCAGESDSAILADLARGRLRSKIPQLQQALQGYFTAHHGFLVTEYLAHIDYLDQAIDQVGTEIDQRLQAEDELVALLDTIPGITPRAAQMIIAEVGTDMHRFPSAKHLASWAGLCPGNHESAGKRLSGRIRHGNRALRQVLMEAAHGASHTKNNYLAAQYHRLAARRGRKRAIVAVAHSLLTIVYYVLERREPYHDLGANYFDERDQTAVEQRLIRRLEKLGYQVILQPQAA